KKMNGPTICRCVEGSARRTSKLPISRLRGTIIASMASQEKRSPGLGSSAGCQLMPGSPFDFRAHGHGAVVVCHLELDALLRMFVKINNHEHSHADRGEYSGGEPGYNPCSNTKQLG